MQMLLTFAGLVMCSSAMLALLPQGGLRKTASLVAGLMILAVWLTSLSNADFLPSLPDLPESLFIGAKTDSIETRQTAFLQEHAEITGR